MFEKSEVLVKLLNCFLDSIGGSLIDFFLTWIYEKYIKIHMKIIFLYRLNI